MIWWPVLACHLICLCLWSDDLFLLVIWWLNCVYLWFDDFACDLMACDSVSWFTCDLMTCFCLSLIFLVCGLMTCFYLWFNCVYLWFDMKEQTWKRTHLQILLWLGPWVCHFIVITERINMRTAYLWLSSECYIVAFNQSSERGDINVPTVVHLGCALGFCKMFQWVHTDKNSYDSDDETGLKTIVMILLLIKCHINAQTISPKSNNYACLFSQ